MPNLRFALVKRFVSVVAFLSLSACSTPAKRIDDMAAKLGFTRSVVRGTEFSHVVYLKRGDPPTASLHVYLEGDGSPWIGTQTVAADPTSRNPLMLQLMALDPAPSVYLGRPCYYGLAAIPPCSPLLWTHERYSARVVDSMAAALQRLGKTYSHVTFLGHSGGGALAMLLAERFANTEGVVTLAGNLDTAAWAEHHHYSPLTGSLNPVLRPALAPHIFQKHYVGALDEEVPPLLTRHFAVSRPNAKVIEFKDFDHRCCWQEVWRAILEDLITSQAAK